MLAEFLQNLSKVVFNIYALLWELEHAQGCMYGPQFFISFNFKDR